VIEHTPDNDDEYCDRSNNNIIRITGKKSKGKAEEDENRKLTNNKDANPQSYHQWMVAELVSCNAILSKAPVGDVCRLIYVCGRLALRLAAKHKSYEKETTQEKRYTIGPLIGGHGPVVYHLC
jgi:hypothetical protein